MLTLFERVEAAFDAPFLQRHSGSGASSRAPIFIIGMPRSGTTLVEQIFASHPRVRAGGELKDVYEAIAQAAVGPRSYYPEMLADFAPGDFRALGERYLERVGTLAQGDRFTDKMPTNFLYAGAISLMLPNAKIVHVRRDPIDTCLSCFEQFFNESTPHAYDLAELGRYYRAYAKLSEHWRRVLPPESYLEVQYEDVVADFESQARRLLEHAGLEWNPQVLAFHLTRRSVRTASAQQVRRPLYAGSIGRASRFGTKLQPLIDAIRG